MPLLSKENLKAERVHSVLSYTWTVVAQNDHLYLYNNIELELELEAPYMKQVCYFYVNVGSCRLWTISQSGDTY